MKKRISKRSLVALLCACVWTLIVLCLSMPLRPAETAHAVESSNDKITVVAESYVLLQEEYTWGEFYRGMKIPSESKYRVVDDDGNVEEDRDGNPKEGTINWGACSYDEDSRTFDMGLLEYGSVLDSEADGHTHNFIEYAGAKDWDNSVDGSDNTHWAVCSSSDCGFQLEVGHRLGTDGECKDCGATLDGYVNEYSFTIPDTFPNDDYSEWETAENTVATIKIPFEATISAGFTLNLYLQCSGVMTNDNGDVISYEVAVDEDSTSHGVGEAFNSEDPDAQIIWWYSPGDDDSLDEYNRAVITDGTIYIMLTLDEVIYPGEYSDTLTFSAELVETEEES